LKINHIFTVPGNALETHVSPENKIRVQSPDPAQRVLVNEIGAYELIFGINMPMAKEFRKYVFETIIQSFCKQLLEDTVNDMIINLFEIKNAS
jgi:prophage antirepressor-like protein